MARILMAAVATPGHVYPMLAIARHLIAQGHQVRVMTGALFRERAEAVGASFVPFDAQVDSITATWSSTSPSAPPCRRAMHRWRWR